jgi:hypothetical protein
MLVTCPPTEIDHGWADFFQIVADDVANDYLSSNFFWDLTWFVARFIADQFWIWYIAQGCYDFEFDNHPFLFYGAILRTKGWTKDYIDTTIETLL